MGTGGVSLRTNTYSDVQRDRRSNDLFAQKRSVSEVAAMALPAAGNRKERVVA